MLEDTNSLDGAHIIMWKIVQRKYDQKVVGTSKAKDSSYH